MSARLALWRADGWLVAVLAGSALGLCSYPSWWMTGTFLFVLLAVSLKWVGAARRCDLLVREKLQLEARVQEFGNKQGRLVGNIAHEIKTPLAVVLAETDLLLLRCEDATAVRGIAVSMAAEIRHLSGLVESFLQLVHPVAQDDTAAHTSVFVSDVVIAAVAHCGALSEEKGVRVVAVLGEPDNGDPSAEVSGDPLLLEIMLENLVRNALRYSPSDAAVEVTTSAKVETVSIAVRDRGIGIPIEQQESVFDWFFEGPDRPSKALGAGFGLAIAKRIANHHGGTITLRGRDGGGCEFVVTMPRCWPSGRLPGFVREANDSAPPITPTA